MHHRNRFLRRLERGIAVIIQSCYIHLISAHANSLQPGQVPGPGQHPKALTARPTRKLVPTCGTLHLTDHAAVI